MTAFEEDDQHQTAQTMKLAKPHALGTWAIEIQDSVGVRRVALGATPLRIGSRHGLGATVHDRTVSKLHCELCVEGDLVSVRDCGSSNGTFVGGARIEHARATNGTVITIGQSSIVCILTPASEANDDPLNAVPLPGVAGRSASMLRIAAQVRRLAHTNAPVLILGETGVGKELVARALHSEGPRQTRPFVALNVAALPRDLVESELFGHERGAFTGAFTRRSGAFADAEGGTLFLDEIGDLPGDAQPKLLRALDGYEIRRIGSAGGGHKPNVRLVAATHVNLQDRAHQGSFRRDLFHRLEVFTIEIPPLRARRGDIVPIARLVLENLESQVGVRELAPSALALLTEHDWPGNVRELRNVLVRAADMTPTKWLDAQTVHRAMGRPLAKRPVPVSPAEAKACVERYNGNISAAARSLELPRTTFRKLIAS